MFVILKELKEYKGVSLYDSGSCYGDDDTTPHGVYH